jgi:hypothetical protein
LSKSAFDEVDSAFVGVGFIAGAAFIFSSDSEFTTSVVESVSSFSFLRTGTGSDVFAVLILFLGRSVDSS